MLGFIFFVLLLSWPFGVHRNRVPRKSQATVAPTEHTWAVFGSIVSVGKAPRWVPALHWGWHSRNGPLMGWNSPSTTIPFSTQNKRKQHRVCTSQLPPHQSEVNGSSFATLCLELGQQICSYYKESGDGYRKHRNDWCFFLWPLPSAGPWASASEGKQTQVSTKATKERSRAKMRFFTVFYFSDGTRGHPSHLCPHFRISNNH